MAGMAAYSIAAPCAVRAMRAPSLAGNGKRWLATVGVQPEVVRSGGVSIRGIGTGQPLCLALTEIAGPWRSGTAGQDGDRSCHFCGIVAEAPVSSQTGILSQSHCLPSNSTH